MKTTVVNIKHGEPYDVYIGRAGKGHDGYFGNPFKLAGSSHALPGTLRRHTRTGALEEFRTYFLARVESDQVFRARVLALRGKRLGCFCAPLPCHGQIIADWIDEQ